MEPTRADSVYSMTSEASPQTDEACGLCGSDRRFMARLDHEEPLPCIAGAANQGGVSVGPA
jgi:hypothetical protein